MKLTETSLGKMVETDVLVLGAGAAGSGAAIAARREGADVVIIDKGRLESCGQAGGGNDHFMAVLNSGPDTDTCDTLVKFYARPVSGLTPAMIENGWYKMMPIVLQILVEEKVNFVKNDDGSYLRSQGFGQPGTWWINIDGGQTVKRLVARRVRAEGVNVFDFLFVTKLLKDAGGASGCFAYDVRNGEFYMFKAKKIVTAMGKSVTRSSLNSTRNPFNTWFSPYVTGGHFALPYEIGAKIMNLDIMEQATLLPKGFGAPGMNGINNMGGKELNALGERFMGKYDPMWENGLRVNQVQGTYQEFVEGKGPPFYMDMTHFSEKDARFLQYVLMPGDKATYNDWTDQMGIDFKRDPLEVELSEIGLEGLLCTDDRFETNVKGLFNGCVFFAFSGAMCGGYYAGMQAAKAALADGKLFDIDKEAAAAEKERVLAPLGRKDGVGYKEFESAFRNVMDYYMGYRRNEKGMRLALKKLELIGTFADKLKAANHHELMRAHESLHLHKTCVLTCLTCLERRESGRAIYKRSDFPVPDAAMEKPLMIWQEEGQFKFSWGR